MMMYNFFCLMVMLIMGSSFAMGSQGCRKSDSDKRNELHSDTIKDTSSIDSDRKFAMLHGSSIQISGGAAWEYYQNRSVESIAEEIELAGYKTVHYFVSFDKINRDLIDAFHHHNIGVWWMVLAKKMKLSSTKKLSAGWERWKMVFTNGSSGSEGYVYLSPFSKDYTKWYKATLAEVMKSYPFDGFEIVEPNLPGWNGFQRDSYGDVGLNARKAFRNKTGFNMPNFSNPNAENYYTKVPDIYQEWIRFRVEGVKYGLLLEIKIPKIIL